MNYRTASRQQLLAERVRLQNAYRKAEQRLGSGAPAGTMRGDASRRDRGSTHHPQREVDQLREQLARVEAELKRRDEQTAQQGTATGEKPAVEG